MINDHWKCICCLLIPTILQQQPPLHHPPPDRIFKLKQLLLGPCSSCHPKNYSNCGGQPKQIINSLFCCSFVQLKGGTRINGTTASSLVACHNHHHHYCRVLGKQKTGHGFYPHNAFLGPFQPFGMPITPPQAPPPATATQQRHCSQKLPHSA